MRVAADGVVPPVDESQLELDVVRMGPVDDASVDQYDCDTLLYVSAGAGAAVIDGEEHALAEGSAAFVPAGAPATLVCTGAGLSVVRSLVSPACDLHAPMGTVEPTTALQEVEPGKATGARSFQVLYGPHNGSVRATLFVGYIPPGKAPWHYHLYDEIVWVVRGEGLLHLREADPEPLSPGSAFRLRPREVHIVENLAADRELVVLGLFTPAGSPSAAYLEAGVLAEYRIG